MCKWPLTVLYFCHCHVHALPNDVLYAQVDHSDQCQVAAFQVERAMLDSAAARRELDAQKAINRALDEQQRTLDDQRMKDEVTIRDLTNELADRSEQVATMQRKLLLARTNRFLPFATCCYCPGCCMQTYIPPLIRPFMSCMYVCTRIEYPYLDAMQMI